MPSWSTQRGGVELKPGDATESSASATATVELREPATEAPPHAGTLAPGTALGRYRVVALVGSGGMGEVYEARDLDLDRRVAIKILSEGRGGRDAAMRLLREAKAMARIVHPNVMTVHEVGSQRGVDYIVMEFVEGIDLRTWAEAKPPWSEVVAAFVEAGRGVAAAHAAGMIHRDLKPANILKANDGRILVTDFGIVRLHAHDTEAHDEAPDAPASGEALTEAGTFMGTPAFAAPEQFTGNATEKSDQYSLCAALYAVLFGRPPHGRRPRAAAGRRVAQPADVDHPQWLWTVIARGLEPNPADRYASVNALVVALSRRTHRRSTWLLAAAGAVASAAVWSSYARQEGQGNGCRPAQTLDEWNERRAYLAESDWNGLGGSQSSTVERLTQRLDAYAEDWSASWIDACEATQVRRVQSDAVMQTRLACLRDRRQRVHAVLEVLATPRPRTLTWAAEAAFALPAIAACNDVSDTLSLPTPDPDVAAAVESIRNDILTLEAGLPTLPLDDAIDESAHLVEAAKAIAFAPVVAEALLARGLALSLAERPKDARATLDEAVLVAEESEHRRIHAHAMVALVQSETELWTGAEAFNARLRRARLAVQRYGYEGLDLALDQAEAEALRRIGDVAGAQQRLRSVIARLRSTHPPDPSRIAVAEVRLADLLADLGQTAVATRMLQAALDRLLAAHGVESQHSIDTRSALAVALRRQSRWHDAREQTLAIEAYLATEAGRSAVEAVFRPFSERIRRDRDRQTEVRVISPTGHARSGVDVVVGRSIVGDGAYAAAGDLTWWVQSGASRVATDELGSAVLLHPNDPVWLVAEHEGGRSWPIRIEGPRDEPVQVELRPWATLDGVVEVSAAGVDRALIHIFPRGVGAGRRVEFRVTADADGRFSARLAAGEYTVGVQILWDDHTRLIHRVDHAVTGDSEAAVQLQVQVPPTTLRLKLEPASAGPSHEVQAFVVRGSPEVTTVASLDVALVETAGRGPMAVGTTEGGVVELRGLPVGGYTLCLVPITDAEGDLQAQLATVLREDETPVHCSPIEITEPVQDLPIAASPTAFRVPGSPP